MISASLDETAVSTAEPRLLLELPSRRRVFFGNLRDLILPRQMPLLELHSSPAAFWPDVLVERRLPWARFVQSVGLHIVALALLIAGTRFFALQPQIVAKPAFDRSQVIYYQASEYLPAIDTRREEAAAPLKADPEFSRQPIISLPPEADNRSQTVVTPPNIKLKRDIALPNIVAWSDTAEKPRLAIPPVPVTPAAEITRIAPTLQNTLAAPPPDAAQLTSRRNSVMLQRSVVAPPPELSASNAPAFQGPQLAVIAPPPSVEASARPLGELNIGPSAVIAPAPQLALAEQRAVPGSDTHGIGAPQLVPPPPSLGAAGSATESFGARGRIIALNLHPTVGAPPNELAGNRRGAFSATPEGHVGASGSPGTLSGNGVARAASRGAGKEIGSGNGKSASDAPSGLYVGSTTQKTSAVAGDKSSSNAVNPNLVASVRPPRVNSASRTMQTESSGKLSAAEREVFGDRKSYSLTLNMPNLNSGGGSWVIRFAELDHNSNQNEPAENLSQPAATRKVDPAYPLQLMRENVAGTVILYAIIHADGTVGNVRVLRGVDERLDRFASQAIAQWQFQPAMKNGTPVDVEATFQIPFRPTRLGTNF
ncbi:MAG TPA: TonB family protein [Candidatus Sulfotelmatobacter sp.]|nr:TonB family protein [Candidatus Sulfotelmatobacter sp.]